MEEKQKVCTLNTGVWCSGGECFRCGWNPKVSAERMRYWKRPTLLVADKM